MLTKTFYLKYGSNDLVNNRKVMGNTIVSIVTIIIVITLFSSNSFKPQVTTAKITDFSVEWTPFPTVASVTSISTFNITIKNNGTVPHQPD
jgi:hypothetical protein